MQFSNQFVLILLSVVLPFIRPAYGQTFSFAIIADPHLDGDADHKAKFETAVDWIIGNKDDKDIELVFVLGDIAWGGPRSYRNLQIAKTILDRLNNAGIPYIPIIGDNEVHSGCEKEFQTVFEPQYKYLSEILGNWQKALTPVNGKYLQNFSFDYKSCHFVCVDFVSRKAGDEDGELHDHAGGSWPWFKNDIKYCCKPKKENIIIMTHIGMFRTGFEFADNFLYSKAEMAKVKHFLYEYRDNVDTNYAGHLHQNWYTLVWSGLFVPLYHVRVTDETWYDTQLLESNDQEITVRWVQIDNSGLKISYHQNIEDIDNGASFKK